MTPLSYLPPLLLPLHPFLLSIISITGFITLILNIITMVTIIISSINRALMRGSLPANIQWGIRVLCQSVLRHNPLWVTLGVGITPQSLRFPMTPGKGGTLSPPHTLLKAASQRADFLLSPSSVPSLSNSLQIQQEKPKASFQVKEEGAGLHPNHIQVGLNPKPEVEELPRASSVPPTLPSYDWVMTRIRELRKGTNDAQPSTGEGSLAHSINRMGEGKFDSTTKGSNKVHFSARDEIISDSRVPKGHGTNVSKSPVVQPIPHRPQKSEFENLASLPPKGNTRTRAPQNGSTLSRKPPTYNSQEPVSNHVPNRRDELDRWNNYGYGFSTNTVQQRQGNPPAGPASMHSAPSSPSHHARKMGQPHNSSQERLYQFNHTPAPHRTERTVPTFNQHPQHAMDTNPQTSVSINTSHPHPSSTHGTVPPPNTGGRTFTRSVSNPGINELYTSVEPNNNFAGGDTFSSLDDAVKMLSHWSNEIQKLSAPYASDDANNNTHANHHGAKSPTTHHHLNHNQLDVRTNSTQFQTAQSNGSRHYMSSPLTNHRPQATSTPKQNFDEIDLHIEEPMENNIPKGVVAERSPGRIYVIGFPSKKQIYSEST